MTKIIVEKCDNGGSRLKGFRLKPRLDYIFVLDYGQPNQTQGGIYLGETQGQYQVYRHSEWRYGEVIACGPGRYGKPLRRKGVKWNRERFMPMPEEVQIGGIVLFNRKTGTRLPESWDFVSPRFPEQGPLHVRVFDPEKIVGVIEDPDWKPWWNIKDQQLNVSGTMTG